MADDKDMNRDPITGTPGSHPIGTGLGAAGGGAAGAAIGAAVGGPVGAVVGAGVGAVAGGITGKGVAEAVNPTIENAYWRDNYMSRPYYTAGDNYDTYQPAYQYGWESYPKFRGRKFDDVETELRSDWDKTKHATNLTWDRAKNATRDAWHRVERALPGDFDNDGR